MKSSMARIAVALAVGTVSAAASGHHGVSTYRMDVVETREGVVAQWTFESPHTWLRLAVDGTT